MQLQVSGEHFNIGNNNVKIKVYRRLPRTLLYEKNVSATVNPGKPAGSFVLKTSADCPRIFRRVQIYATDKDTNRESTIMYP
jgi:hypothetical protein